ncbi:hypothetical protein [Castellaniella caeni]|uniref:hypothetical protein n=1 Tax=Castellaniella caeni TaxID=266123 RepID=UPI0012ED8D30|nr:hypothetical protein [Castellaniella caeni]
MIHALGPSARAATAANAATAGEYFQAPEVKGKTMTEKFGSKLTTNEVLAGADLTAKRFLITDAAL